ncbi:MAG: SLBB domain-containing protein [Armatimonadetes bacterium]|nr:SLBB domain-containing protein [Armatimonadota bacterium]
MSPTRLLATMLVLLPAAALPQVNLQEYAIGPGDVLKVQVFGEKELTGDYRVGPGGSITIPDIGAVSVSGLTVEEAARALTKALSRIIKQPNIVVAVDEIASERKVYVGGRVNTPGPLTLPFGSTVLDAILMAGLLPDADLRRVSLTRAGQPPMTLDLSGWRTAQGVALGELLRYGDMIFVPELVDRISVLGAVAMPGSVVPPLGQRITLLDALARIAGGLATGADPTNATVLRKNGEPVRVNLQKLLFEGDMSQNVDLEPGDVVVVPEAKHISVVGQVEKPVAFVASRPVPVLNALAQAGQTLPTADLRHAKLVTPQGTRELDLEALLEQGEKASEVVLQPGDVLVLPEAAPEEVLLAGEVQKPGPLNIHKVRQRDLLRIVTAVGLTPKADGTRVCVLRGDHQIVVDYDAMLKEADLSRNMTLEPGDVVYVPSLDKVYVLGAVGQGGAAVPCPDTGLKVLDALIEAGGLGQQADPDEIHVVRPRPDGTTEHVRLKMSEIRRGRLPSLVTLKPGDIVYVAARGRAFDWRDLRELLWTVAGLRSLFR